MTDSRDFKLVPVANLCSAGGCPTVYDSGRGSVVVQGYAVSAAAAKVDLPEGELLVEIPVELLAEAARGLLFLPAAENRRAGRED
ncbi:hypothetical protein GCM10010435_02440 [Winogradskya consettensis]|uniref:Uncharacterized protein n=1 Tax=Winogradskya consettensis TaxID=113560 RepID=A0A919VHS5_9ACTN|nr:hypothetical protein [Actinoplanes consettensis]GIM66114.1 hypothetical protein Aco04nite_00510 [Actinoplanes consettensis]